MEKIKTYKASAIVTTIVILSVILTTILSIIFVSNIGRSMSSDSNESLRAYQRADMGAEKALSAIVAGYSSPNTTDTKIPNGDYWKTSPNDAGECDSTTGIITKKDSNGKVYTLELLVRKFKADKTIDPNDPTISVKCSDTAVKFSEIILVKSVGIIPGKVQRAISATVPKPPKTP